MNLTPHAMPLIFKTLLALVLIALGCLLGGIFIALYIWNWLKDQP
jgi:hypothetical protein